MKPIQLPDIKRGNIFEYIITIKKDNQLYDILLADIRAEVRTEAGKLLAECDKELISVGCVRFFVNDTNSWPIGLVESDYDAIISEKPISSPTYRCTLINDITRPT